MLDKHCVRMSIGIDWLAVGSENRAY